MAAEEAQERPALGRLLESLRKRKRFTRHALSGSSGVSTTYIVQIESGVDSRSGKEVRPSPPILWRLAEALGDGDVLEARGYYGEMMAAAGYLPGSEAAPEPPRVEEKMPYVTQAKRVSEPIGSSGNGASAVAPEGIRLRPDEPTRGYAEPARPATLELRDPRLRGRFREVMERWEELSPEEQTAVLTLMELLSERLGRR